MKRGVYPLCPLVVLFFIFLSFNALFAQSDPEALSILRHVDDLWRGDSSYAEITMKVKTKHYTRTMGMEACSKGTEETFVRITSPLKDKGTATLKSGKHIYTYLPRTDRTIRLTSGMMMASWMGSHFTNDDLVKESRREDDYGVEITFKGKRAGEEIIEFTLRPKPDAAVIWGKVVLVIRAEDFIPLKEVSYDEDMLVARTFTFNKLKILGGQLRPSVMRMIPEDKSDEFTELTYEKLEINIPVKDDLFSIARLKRR